MRVRARQVREFASINDKYGLTAADLAQESGHLELARLLRKFCHKTQRGDLIGETPCPVSLAPVLLSPCAAAQRPQHAELG